MSQPVASVTSSSAAIDGNDNNSSLDFQFLELPASGNLTVNIGGNPNSGSISFTLWQDETGRDGEVQKGLKNGSTIEISGNLKLGDSYYIGNPSNAGGQTFVVTFTAG